MSVSATRTGELLANVSATCDRLVHPAIVDGETRQRHRRLIGLMLAGPVLMAGTFAALLPQIIGNQAALIAIGTVVGTAWLLGLYVVGRAEHGAVGPAALALGAISIAAVIAAGGGLASPLTLLAASLPLEAWWLSRNSRGLALGLAAAMSTLPLQAIFSEVFSGSVPPPSPIHWIVPLAYFACVLPRAMGRVADPEARQPDLDELADLADAAVLEMAPSGDVLGASANMRPMLSLDPGLLLGDGFFDRVHIADRVAYLCALADLRRGAHEARLEVRLRLPRPGKEAPEPSYFPFSLRLRSVVQGGGQRLFATLRSNEEVAALRAALAAEKDRAEGAEAEKSRLMAAVSHELRTPLNAIIGFTDMLLHEFCGKFSDRRQIEYIALVRASGSHLLGVVNAILEMSKIELGAYTINREPFRFRDAVDFCHSMLKQHAAAKKLKLLVQVAPQAGEIWADRRAVQQMLINLISNAVKFTPEGGTIILGGSRIGSRLHVWVSDTGIGMSPEDLSRVGEPFTQVHDNQARHFDGAGLGLSVVKGLVSLHQGTMAIESELGAGTTVTISIPVGGPANQVVPTTIGSPVVQAAVQEGHDAEFRKTA